MKKFLQSINSGLVVYFLYGLGLVVFIFSEPNDKIGWLLLGLYIAMPLLTYFASRKPTATWVRVLFSDRGPRTDTQYMTKKNFINLEFNF